MSKARASRRVTNALARARELEDRLEELRAAVHTAMEAHELGQPPEVIFKTLRTAIEHVPAGRWTPRLCIDKAHEWEAEHGEPPAAINWNPAAMRQRNREHLLAAWAEGDWPSLATVQRLFGSWNAYLAAAGYEPRTKADPANRGPGGRADWTALPEWHGWEVVGVYRDRLGLSQARLAERAKVSIEYLGHIERGRQTNPSVRVLLGIARALSVPGAVLLDDQGRPEK